MTLNPRQGERAVLIKNSSGDWGFCKGKWINFVRGRAEQTCEYHYSLNDTLNRDPCIGTVHRAH